MFPFYLFTMSTLIIMQKVTKFYSLLHILLTFNSFLRHNRAKNGCIKALIPHAFMLLDNVKFLFEFFGVDCDGLDIVYPYQPQFIISLMPAFCLNFYLLIPTLILSWQLALLQLIFQSLWCYSQCLFSINCIFVTIFLIGHSFRV